ncbi:MAG: hypothetical protein R3E86_03465 [Pseudomonadales bacterium]
MLRTLAILVAVALLPGACASSPTADRCAVRLGGTLEAAMQTAEDRLADGCEYQFDSYFQSLLAIAESNPDRRTPMLFSDFLMRQNDQGVISRRQAESLYNRYFNVKFVSLQGDYNTCSQTCPVRARVLSDMQAELHDKEMGLMRASEDAPGYYRADNLLKETELVLEAVCRACDASANAAAGLGSR